ncbi:MAG: metal ABC transporter permease [Simkaniaceae bacterium]|nr:metal ABC transporter permease [Simkaniaceae bacterium]
MIFRYLTDPILQAPFIATLLMALCAGLYGTFIFVKRRSLLAETLSHAAYPGLGIAAMTGSSMLLGGLFAALIALYFMGRMQRNLRVAADPTLCFTLASALGFGVLIASYLQGVSPALSRKMQVLLYGQAATMTTAHIYLYAALAIVTLAFFVLSMRILEAIAFDASFSRKVALPVFLIEGALQLLTALTIVLGLRSVGALLISGMLIAPAIAARQWSSKLLYILPLSATFALLSAFIGNTIAFERNIPSGPVMVLVAGAFAIFSLLAAPNRGLISRLVRRARFRFKMHKENVLKLIWHHGGYIDGSQLHGSFVLWSLRRQGLIKGNIELTALGNQRAERVVRLHRLWELYLSNSLGYRKDAVHENANWMEHILTPELEKELTELLNNPTSDPHSQPIPGVQR